MNPELIKVCTLYRNIPREYHTNYVIHIPQEQVAIVGIGQKRIITYDGQRLKVSSHNQEEEVLVSETEVFDCLGEYINSSKPLFFLISLDIVRQFKDPNLPLMIFIEPEIELTFHRSNCQEPQRIYGNIEPISKLLNQQKRDVMIPTKYQISQKMKNWLTNEDDQSFLSRLEKCIKILEEKEGKMILMREWKKNISSEKDLFHLFEIYAGLESKCAAAHFFQWKNNFISMGCSPENIFEVNQGKLVFDVVAGTRGIVDDKLKDKRWQEELKTDPKEITEHKMALERYRHRIEKLCQVSTVKTTNYLEEKTLSRVRHLYSRLEGKLKSNLDLIDLLTDSYPPLESYPKELIPLADCMTNPTHFYGGMIGYQNQGAELIKCYLNLRSLLAQNNLLFTLGGVGVIKNSLPELELLEVYNKLRAIDESVLTWENL